MDVLKSIKWQFYILSLQFLFVMLLILNLKICLPSIDTIEVFNTLVKNSKNWIYVSLITILIIWFIKKEIKRTILVLLGSILILILPIEVQEIKIVIPCIIMILLGRGFKWYLNRNEILSKGLPKEVKNIQEQNLDPSSFMATYIVPMIAFQYKELQNFIVLIIYLIVVGKIYLNTKLYYTNPTLNLLGYKIYTIDTVQEEDIVLITKEEIKKDDFVITIKLDNKIFLGRKKTK